jgi:hypothetical protein
VGPVQEVAARIDAECKRQAIPTTILAKVMGVSYRKARAVRTGRNGPLYLIDIIRAARVLDVPIETLLKSTNIDGRV